MEFYGLTLYAGLIPQISDTFFPETSNSILMGLLTFGVSFFFRPLGGLICGRIGDIKGRKAVINWSITLMGLANIIIAFLPSYQSWGMFSMAILVLCRVIQGFCVGIEYSGAFTFGLEHAPAKDRSRIGGWISGSCFFGFALGLIFTQCAEYLPPHYWRLGFLLSSIFTITAIFLRQKLGESPEFLMEKEKSIATQPVISWPLARKAFIFSCSDGMLTYTVGGFLLVYLTHYMSFDKTLILRVITGFIILISFMCVGFAKITKSIKPITLFKYALVIGSITLPPLFTWVATTHSTLALTLLLLATSALTACFVGIQPIILYQIIPVKERMTTSSVGYNSGLAITGGLLPVMFAWIIEKTGCISSPGYILSFLLLVILYSTQKQKL